MNKMKQLWLLTAVAVVGVLAGGHFLAVAPKKGEVAELHNQAVAQQTDNQKLQVEINRLLDQQKLVPAKQKRLAEIAKNIPSSPMLPALVRSLTKASRSSGTVVRLLEPVAPEFAEDTPTAAAPAAAPKTGARPAAPVARPDVGQLAVVPIKVTLYATYGELQEFLIDLEDLPRSMLVTGATIERQLPEDFEGFGQPGDLKVVLDARVFMRAKSAAPPATSRPAPNASAPAANE
jgi:Tfp pilus assembly protein PilO